MRQYLHLLQDVLAHGEPHEDRTGVGTTSLFGYQLIHRMEEGFPLLTTKKLPFRWIVEELKWFLSGSTDEKALAEKGVDIWKEWATEEQCAKFGRAEGDLGPIYGSLWRNFPVGNSVDDPHRHPNQVDQIAELLNDIRETPNSRRLIVTGWHPYYQKRVALPPCHTLWQVKCQNNNKMSLELYARSIDAFLGLPFNIASYALLLSVLCKLTARTPKHLIISFGDLHIYDNHRDAVEEQLRRDPHTLPRLELSNVNSITDWDAKVVGYKFHPAISAPVAV
jgi:thymidylate synthase